VVEVNSIVVFRVRVRVRVRYKKYQIEIVKLAFILWGNRQGTGHWGQATGGQSM
jgi:hypothetical protein